MKTKLPLERFRDLADLPHAGYESAIVASADELRRLAEWADVDEVTRLVGRVDIRPQSRTRFLLETEFEADIVQKSVVTLKPLRSRIARSFRRTLQLSPGLQPHADKGGLVTLASADDETPEEIDSTRYDLAGPLREELLLAIDPYPRAPGETFELPGDADTSESPFAVLEKLKPEG
ncbi:MAG TPA: hypothetical protein VNX86_08830 [Rhizomicrobium sp.]|nr:hypothetical protein [Rhizomicrobium sp.]